MWRRPTVTLFVFALLLAGSAQAQYFGQNKVRYETLDWQVLKTEHFDIHYYTGRRETVEEFGRMAERW
jgi:hypothetical protein